MARSAGTNTHAGGDGVTIHPPTRVEVYPDGAAASRAAAEAAADVMIQAVERNGRATVALSGGSTPVEMYEQFATPELSARIPWDRVHLLWGDERCVPPGHPRSNFGMAWRAFISGVPIPSENLHRMRGELPPKAGAEEYRRLLDHLFTGDLPRFDLVHMGVGDDGHTASLFPYQMETLFERDMTACNAFHVDAGEYRITLTLPVINAAARIDFLALGQHKASIVRTVLHGPLDPVRIPAQLVHSADGEVVWTVDAAVGVTG